MGISGIWVFKGQQLAFEHSEDWQVNLFDCTWTVFECKCTLNYQVDYASYDWVKLDPTVPATRATVNQYLR